MSEADDVTREQIRQVHDGLCGGQLRILIADESSWRCTVCDWIGWPRQEVHPTTGVILRQFPHPRTDRRRV